MEIGIECHFRWNRASAERIVRALEPYDILFLEDPLPAVHVDEIRLLAQRSPIPIVGSELLMTRWQLREWLEKHTSQILMTDPLWNGGVGETRKIAAMAEAFGVPLVLHNLSGPVCHAVCLHIGAHIPNLMFVESARALYGTVFAELASEVSPPVHGRFALPRGPGHGVTLRADRLAQPDVQRQVSSGDGMAAGRRAMGDHWAREQIR